MAFLVCDLTNVNFYDCIASVTN